MKLNGGGKNPVHCPEFLGWDKNVAFSDASPDPPPHPALSIMHNAIDFKDNHLSNVYRWQNLIAWVQNFIEQSMCG